MTFEQLIEKLQELVGRGEVLPNDRVKLSYNGWMLEIKRYNSELNKINLTRFRS